MTRNQIICMAKEQGLPETEIEGVFRVNSDDLGRLLAAEREACANLCDEIAIDMWKLYKGRPPYKGDEEGRASDFTQGRSAGADDCADAIRARSTT